jgi:hypothetical protein
MEMEMSMNVINFKDKSCERVRENLDAHLSNELTNEFKLEVLEHLKRCPTCAEALANAQRIKDALKRAIHQEKFAPPGLQQRISKEIQRQPEWNYRWAAVAAIVVLTVGILSVRQWMNARRGSQVDIPLQTTGNQRRSEKDNEAYALGLDDHINCALRRDFTSGPLSFEQISKDIGTDYVALASLIKEKIPQNYTLTAGHQCDFHGRNFVHLILTDRKNTLSIVLTKKQGETFDKGAPDAQVAGTPLYQAHRQEQESLGFETSDFLAYVVSGLAGKEHLQIASSLIPSISKFLARLENE